MQDTSAKPAVDPNEFLSDCCGTDVTYDKENDWLVCIGCKEPCAGKPRTLGINVKDVTKAKEHISGEGA